MGPRLGLGLRAGAALSLLMFAVMAGSAAADPTPYTWSGGDVSGPPFDFSSSGNWDGGTAPTAGTPGTFVFPAVTCPAGDTACYQADDDLTGASFDSITLSGTGYTIGGSDLTASLSGGISEDGSGGALNNTIALPLNASATQDWALTGDGTSGSAVLNLSGALTGDDITVEAKNAAELELSDAGDTAGVAFDGSGTGPNLLLVSGNVGANLAVDDATVQLDDDNTLGTLTATDDSNIVIGGSIPGGATTATGGSVNATNSTLTFEIDGGTSPTEPNAAELNVDAGSLTLSGTALALDWGGVCPTFADDSIGVPLTLVSAAGSSITGTFTNAANDSLVTMNCTAGTGDPQPQFEINYTGSAITATPVTASTTTLAVSPSGTTAIDQPVTLTATVALGHGTGPATPSGTVAFEEGGDAISGCSAQPLTPGTSNATATCTIPLDPSGASVVANYDPADAWEVTSSSSPQALPATTEDGTTASLLSDSSVGPGVPVMLTTHITAILSDQAATLASPYIIPTGTVAFTDEDGPINCQNTGENPVPLTPIGLFGAANAICTTMFPSAGVYHQITVFYSGDANFTGSSVMQPIGVGVPTATISAPISGDTFYAGSSGSAAATAFTCSDPYGPGIASCTDADGSPSPGLLDTCQPGTSSYTVTAKSKDGAIATASITYTVIGTPPAGTCGTSIGGGNTGGGNTGGGTGGSGGGSSGSPTGSVKTGSVKVSGLAVNVPLSCTGGASGTVTLQLTAQKVVGSGKHRKTVRVVVGKAVTTLAAGAHRTVKLKLNAGGQALLKKLHTLHATLLIKQTAAGKSRTLASKSVVFRSAKR